MVYSEMAWSMQQQQYQMHSETSKAAADDLAITHILQFSVAKLQQTASIAATTA